MPEWDIYPAFQSDWSTTEKTEQFRRRRSGRCRVLAGDQLAVNNDIGGEVLVALPVVAPVCFEDVFEQLGNHVGEPDGGFLAVGEARDIPTFDQEIAVGVPAVL